MPEQLHHYVPQFILRKFGTDTGVLHVMDKHTGKCFPVSAGKKSTVEIAAERGMYDFVFMGTPMTMEPSLSELESKAALVIQNIIDRDALDPYSVIERATLASFLAVQMVRTRATAATHDDVSDRMEAWLRGEGMPEEFFAIDPKMSNRENAKKVFRARMLTNATTDFGPALAEKDWVLLKTDEKYPYLMGDQPLAMFNDVDHGPRGNLGIKVRGIQIYFPLTPTLALALWCPSLQEGLLKKVNDLSKLYDAAPERAAKYAHAWEGTIRIVEAIRNGKPLLNRPESVPHFNSLQIISAERFLFSQTGDFSLAKDMIAKDPTLRNGPRMQEATGKF